MPTSRTVTVGATATPLRSGATNVAGMIVTPAAAIRISGADVTSSVGTLLSADERVDLPGANWQAARVGGSDVAVVVTEYEAGD